jgi:PilZ domain
MPPVKTSYAAPREIQGRIQNVSEGGVCILSSQPLPLATFVFCEIAMPDIPVPIPSLMQVRWTSKRGKDTHHYMNGLRFISA